MKNRALLFLVALTTLTVAAFAQKAPVKKPKPAPKTKVVRKMPMRDPKTGRFVKATPHAKKPPMRDPKTGRFIKKG